MNVNLAGSAVVIVARQFNPTIVDQLWLVENKIVAKDEFRRGCIFTDDLVHITTGGFSLLLAQNQIQFVPLVDPTSQQSLIEDRVGKLVATLPHTPCVAIGLNFTYHLFPPSSQGIADFSRQLFGNPTSKFFADFGSADAQFGAYCCKDYLKGRLKLDAKPVNSETTPLVEGEITSGEMAKEFVMLNFNYHVDLDRSDSVGQIAEVLESWNNVVEQTQITVKSLS